MDQYKSCLAQREEKSSACQRGVLADQTDSTLVDREKWYFCQNTAMSQWKEWKKVLQNNVQKVENGNVFSF